MFSRNSRKSPVLIDSACQAMPCLAMRVGGARMMQGLDACDTQFERTHIVCAPLLAHTRTYHAPIQSTTCSSPPVCRSAVSRTDRPTVNKASSASERVRGLVCGSVVSSLCLSLRTGLLIQNKNKISKYNRMHSLPGRERGV